MAIRIKAIFRRTTVAWIIAPLLALTGLFSLPRAANAKAFLCANHGDQLDAKLNTSRSPRHATLSAECPVILPGRSGNNVYSLTKSLSCSLSFLSRNPAWCFSLTGAMIRLAKPYIVGRSSLGRPVAPALSDPRHYHKLLLSSQPGPAHPRPGFLLLFGLTLLFSASFVRRRLLSFTNPATTPSDSPQSL